MTRMSRHDMLVGIARIIAERSSCSRAAVGCIIVRDGRVISSGYNGAPTGMRHCEHQCTCSKPQLSLHASPGASNWITEGCPQHDPNLHCLVALHAEANALVFAARHGMATDGALLYTTRAPCLNCAGLIINAGIVQVWCGEPHSNQDGINLLVMRKIGVASPAPE